MESAKNLKIIVVDDDQNILDSFRMIFHGTGFHLTCVNNGQAAIDQVKENTFHIAFIDVFMPEMDGLETLIRLIEINPELQAVMISGFRNEKILEKALKAGANNYLYKPLDVQDIFGITLKLANKLGIEIDPEFMFG